LGKPTKKFFGKLMKYLVIEDNSEKRWAVESQISSLDKNAIIDAADNLDDARIQILTKSYDLIVFDIFLPPRKKESEQDVSDDLIHVFAKSKNYHCESIALTLFSDGDLPRAQFNDHGITVVSYDDEAQWKDSLKQKIERIILKPRSDFLVFCALSKERAAFQMANAKLLGMSTIAGLNCQELVIGGYKGFCITPQRMGLVNMAITAAKAIEIFQPKMAAMSGICAGVDGETKLLDLVIGDICWEYQTGKYKDNKFMQEPYQALVSNELRVHLEQVVEEPGFLQSLKNGLHDSELKESGLRLGPISSGSAVVADVSKMNDIGMQHRKWAGLEMEMYAFYEAAAQSQTRPVYFGAKAVVDMGTSAKGDALHNSACVLSARFVTEILRRFLPKYADSRDV
jgi:adenosylhomocysteine nucleosidase